ncbi:hypothetical protein EHS25_003417 [Saitozyma podzolica]|uniref:30S ribosomal protein S15 n=1 Tax=Saitozyma podzolica TaxID=1890683 RepID=A0A427Y760_9TREE|nr:hypothetical protein EHS25_003417 [Saitozyma podzolica]
MSRPFSITSLRAALPSPRPSPAAFSLPLASGSSSAFSTTSPASASKTRILAKRKKAAHLAKRAALSAEVNAGRPDPVLGYVVSTAGPSRSSASTSAAPSSSPWDGCRLQRILLRPEAIYAIPPPDYSVDQSPLHHLPGLSQTDKDILFGAVPHASTELAFAEGIEVTNRQRVIDEFGRKEPGKGTDTGSSEVQAALLTQKIRSLAEHVHANPRDNSNMRALKMLVLERARVLKYFKRKHPERLEGELLF